MAGRNSNTESPWGTSKGKFSRAKRDMPPMQAKDG